jgi:hypothetical protein
LQSRIIHHHHHHHRHRRHHHHHHHHDLETSQWTAWGNHSHATFWWRKATISFFFHPFIGWFLSRWPTKWRDGVKTHYPHSGNLPIISTAYYSLLSHI